MTWKVMNAIAISILLSPTPTHAVAQHVTLPERVELNGGKPMTLTTLIETVPTPIADLAQRSDLVVKGRLSRLRSYMSEDQVDVYTDYRIMPHSVLHSKTTGVRTTPGPQAPLVLRLVGGEIMINGTPVTVNDAKQKPLNLQGEFLIFASRLPTENSFLATGGSAGIFEVTGDQRLEPLLKRIDTDPEVHGIPFEEIVRRIQAAVQRK